MTDTLLMGTKTGARCPVCEGPMTARAQIGSGLNNDGAIISCIVETECKDCGWQGQEWLEVGDERKGANVGAV